MNIKRFINDKKFSCNVYIIQDERGNFVVDPGFFSPAIKSYIDSIGGINFILITHGHFDHISGIDEYYQNYKNISIYALEAEIPLIYNKRHNCSLSMDEPFIPNVEVLPISEGRINLGKYQFNVISTPGHTKGSCIYYFKDDNVIFFGDTLLGESIGRTDLPTGSDADIYNTLIKVKKLLSNCNSMCYFGHGRPASYQEVKKYNIYLQ